MAAKSKVDYSEYLNVNVEDVPDKVAPPVGHYEARIKSLRNRDIDFNQGEGPLPHLTVDFALGNPLDDVDPSGVDMKALKGLLVSKDYRLDDGTAQRWVRDFATGALHLPTKGLQLSDIIREHLPSCDVILEMDQRAGKGEREGQFFPQVKKVLAPDAEIG